MREASGDRINRGLSTVQLWQVKKILELMLCCSAGVQPRDTLSGGSVRYLLRWLRLTFPSTALQSFPVILLSALPSLRNSAAQTETLPCRATFPTEQMIQSKCPAQDLPREGRERKSARPSKCSCTETSFPLHWGHLQGPPCPALSSVHNMADWGRLGHPCPALVGSRVNEGGFFVLAWDSCQLCLGRGGQGINHTLLQPCHHVAAHPSPPWPCPPPGQCTHVQGPRTAEVDVKANLVAKLHEVFQQLGLGWGVAAKQGLLREGAVDLMGHSHVCEQHELFHQPAAREKQPRAPVREGSPLGSQASP